MLTLWEKGLQQFLGSKGVYSDVASRPPHILIDLNGKELADLGLSHISNTLTNTFLFQSHSEVTLALPKKLQVFYFLSFLLLNYKCCIFSGDSDI